DEEPERFVRHEVRRHLDLVATVGARTRDERLSLAVPLEASERVRWLIGGREASRPWCVMHPGATAPSRQYPVESFAAVARALTRDHGWQVVVAAGPTEASLSAKIAADGPGALDLGGRLTLGEVAALIEEAPLLIGNNSL